MMQDFYAGRHHHPPLLESAEIVVALVLMSACWFAWYVARERYYLTSRQLAELVVGLHQVRLQIFLHILHQACLLVGCPCSGFW